MCECVVIKIHVCVHSCIFTTASTVVYVLYISTNTQSQRLYKMSLTYIIYNNIIDFINICMCSQINTIIIVYTERVLC